MRKRCAQSRRLPARRHCDESETTINLMSVVKAAIRRALPLFCLATTLLTSFAWGTDEYEQPPIEYSTSTAHNCVSDLQAQLERNAASLKYEPKQGYLRALLEKLKIDPSSQVLVFSKTSEQRDRISPRTPRAIY